MYRFNFLYNGEIRLYENIDSISAAEVKLKLEIASDWPNMLLNEIQIQEVYHKDEDDINSDIKTYDIWRSKNKNSQSCDENRIGYVDISRVEVITNKKIAKLYYAMEKIPENQVQIKNVIKFCLNEWLDSREEHFHEIMDIVSQLRED